MTTLTISPVTRIEGHADIEVQTDTNGRVTDAKLKVLSFRGFERFLQGVALERLPALTSRVCGVCPVAHQLASVKAIENGLGVTIPPAAVKLRELLLMGQYLASHPVTLGVLSLPDLAMPEGPRDKRNVVGLLQADPGLVQGVLAVRELGVVISNTIGRREVHVGACIIGGMSKPLAEEERADLEARLRATEPALRQVIGAVRSLLAKVAVDGLGGIPAPSLGLSRAGALTLYDGQIAIADDKGRREALVDDGVYPELVNEQVLDGSYMKAPVLKDGRWFRVGPLARLNVNERIDTPWAGAELETFRQKWGHPAHSTLLYHYARTIELIYAWERALALVTDPGITDPSVWTGLEARAGVGIGVIEAPRGTLVHRYWLNAEGFATAVTLVVATQHNTHAINATLAELAPQVVVGQAGEPGLNRLEMVVRAYDPCLSCATH